MKSKSVFRRGITPEETLDAIAEIAYEEFQLKVPKEKIMITLTPHERHFTAAEASIRKEIIAVHGKDVSEEIIQKRLKRDETYIWRKGEIFERDVSVISGYEIRVFPLTKTMGTTPESLYYSIETIAHEIGHALQDEFERDIKSEDASCMRKKYAEGKYSDLSRALMEILNNNEIKKYHLSIVSRYSYQTGVKCIKEHIKNAEAKLKNTEATEKKQRLETIISHLYELKEAVSELDIIHKEELKELNTGTDTDKKRDKALGSKAYLAIREGWAQYFSMVVMQKLIAKEIAGSLLYLRIRWGKLSGIDQ